MPPLIQRMLAHIEQKDPAHAARLRVFIEQNDAAYASKAAEFFSRYQSYIESQGKYLEYGLDCYLKLCAQMVHERLEFLHTGRYANRSFAEVERQIYLNPEEF